MHEGLHPCRCSRRQSPGKRPPRESNLAVGLTGIPVDIAVPAAGQQGTERAQGVPMADENHPTDPAGAEQAAERPQPLVHVDNTFPAAPAHLTDVSPRRGRFGRQLSTTQAVEAPMVLLAQRRTHRDGQPADPADGVSGLTGTDHVAAPQFLGTPVAKQGGRSAGLGMPGGSQLRAHLVTEHPPVDVAGGLAVAHQRELENALGHAGSLTSPLVNRGLGLAGAVLLDQLLPDPPNEAHPVAWFGRWAGWLETRLWADSKPRGALFTTVALAPVAALGVGVELLTRRHPVAHTVATAMAGWVVIGAGSLSREGEAMADRLEAGDLPGARSRLSHLCGRLPDDLDEPELARATVESMAENTADSAIASLWWGTVAGIPGMLVHRGANTLDATVGHRNPRYVHFGTVSARLDDLLDLAPARLTAALAAAVAPFVQGRPGDVVRIVLRDAHDHPSPNGGWCESAWAGALRVRLGGHNVYPGGVAEDRGLLGDGPRPRAPQVRRASKLVRWVTLAGAGIAFGACALAGRNRR